MKRLGFYFAICILSAVLCPIHILAQSPLEREIAREIALDSNGAFLYQHSDGYRNGIRYRARKALEQQGLLEKHLGGNEEFLAIPNAKDVSNNQYDQNETTIAISRTDPKLIIAGSNDEQSQDLQMPVYRSTDGGLSWHMYRLPALPEDRLATSDPVVAADANGHFYYAFLTDPKYAALPIQLVVAVSTDGMNWTDMQPVGVQPAVRSFQDKPAITTDNSPISPHFGRVYLAWTVITDDDPQSGIRMSYSDDAGKNWSAMKILTTGFNDTYAQLCTGKNGEIFLSYSNLDDSLHELLVSTDGGDTFDSICINSYIDYPTTNEGRSGLKGAGGFRSSPFATIRADLTTNRLHAVYGNWKNWSATDSSAELLYSYSNNLGASWSAPLAIGDPEHTARSMRDRFFPWLAYDEYTHAISLLYYSSEQDTSNLRSMPYRATIGSNGPGPGIPIGDSLFNPMYNGTGPSAPFIGDYIGCDVFHNEFAAAWTQNRPGHTDGDVFAYAGVTDSTFSGVANHIPIKLNADRLWLSTPYPNPVQNHFAINIIIPQSDWISLDIFSETGALVRHLFSRTTQAGSYTENIDVSGLASGNYLLRLSSSDDLEAQALTIEH